MNIGYVQLRYGRVGWEKTRCCQNYSKWVLILIALMTVGGNYLKVYSMKKREYTIVIYNLKINNLV